MICNVYEAKVEISFMDSGGRLIAGFDQREYACFEVELDERGYCCFGITGMHVDSFDVDCVRLRATKCVNGDDVIVNVRIDAAMVGVPFDILDWFATHR